MQLFSAMILVFVLLLLLFMNCISYIHVQYVEFYQLDLSLTVQHISLDFK